MGCSFTVLFASWGRNDAIPSTLFVLACFSAISRPRLAGLMLGLAISFKFLFLVALLPLGWWVRDRAGSAGLKRLWTMPAFLAVTILPFFVVDPSAFVEDTLLFNLGLTDLVYPASGIGLPVLAPGVFGFLVVLASTFGCTWTTTTPTPTFQPLNGKRADSRAARTHMAWQSRDRASV